MSSSVASPDSPHSPFASDHRFGGWEATLNLAYGRRQLARQVSTVPILRRHNGPLRVLRHFDPDGTGLCEHTYVHPPGGMVGGDRIVLNATLEPHAEVLLTNPGAAKWYRSVRGPARQHVRCDLGAESSLEHLPQPTIVFNGADVAISADYCISTKSRLVVWDIVSLGLAPDGPLAFKSGRFRSATRFFVGDRLAYLDGVDFSAGDRFQLSPIGLGGHTVFGSFVATLPDTIALDTVLTLVEATRVLPIDPGHHGSVTHLAGGPLLFIARCLGSASDAVFRWFCAIWRILRPTVVGREALPPRIWYT